MGQQTWFLAIAWGSFFRMIQVHPNDTNIDQHTSGEFVKVFCPVNSCLLLFAMPSAGKSIVVMPAFNAARTIEQTYFAIRESFDTDGIIIVDDCSRDQTVEVARGLPGSPVIVCHPVNRGYGGNQKTCYATALELGAEVVMMVHADYQYTPRLLPAFDCLLRSGHYDMVVGSRLIGSCNGRAEMPKWRVTGSRLLTWFQNWLFRETISEYHTGYRGYRKEVLEGINFSRFSDDFLFDSQMLMHVLNKGFRVGEISCPAHYFPEASSMPLSKALRYGVGCIREAIQFRLGRSK